MAAVTPPSDQAAELLQKLSLDSQQAPEPGKKTSTVQYAPVDTGSQANGPNKQFDRSAAPFGPDFLDTSMFQNPNGYTSSTYYYGGVFSDSSVNDWDRYSSPNGVEMPPGVYGDYQNSYGYAPYVPYSSSGSPMGYDSQLYATQHYQYPTSYFQPSGTNSGAYASNRANTSQADVSTSIAADQVQLSIGTAKGNQSAVGNAFNNRTNVSKPVRSNYQKPPIKSNDFYGWGGLASASSVNSSAFSYGNNFASGRNQNLRSLPHVMGLQHPQGMDQAGFVSRMYPSNRMYGHYPATYRSGPGYASSNYDNRGNGHGWLAIDNKYKSRGCSSSVLVYDRDQYNKDDFPELHSDAKFFIIKSYSEDDVHKSIKYGVWASTPNGNKKLDAAYKEAQEKPGACPVFLLFSVNASGQFVGLAEMIGPVDFEQTVEYWQQDKWTGCLPVKWHIIKDVPNSMLRHITLQNNKNKPVTNSRDTQEVNFEQGTEIIKIFKSHSSRTCILDDFEFYEGRQRTMQERKAKQKELNKQVDDMTAEETEKTELSSSQGVQRSLDPGSSLADDRTGPLAAGPGVVESSGELNNGLVTKAEDSFSSSRSDIKENKAISNGAPK